MSERHPTPEATDAATAAGADVTPTTPIPPLDLDDPTEPMPIIDPGADPETVPYENPEDYAEEETFESVSPYATSRVTDPVARESLREVRVVQPLNPRLRDQHFAKMAKKTDLEKVLERAEAARLSDDTSEETIKARLSDEAMAELREAVARERAGKAEEHEAFLERARDSLPWQRDLRPINRFERAHRHRVEDRRREIGEVRLRMQGMKTAYKHIDEEPIPVVKRRFNKKTGEFEDKPTVELKPIVDRLIEDGVHKLSRKEALEIVLKRHQHVTDPTVSGSARAHKEPRRTETELMDEVRATRRYVNLQLEIHELEEEQIHDRIKGGSVVRDQPTPPRTQLDQPGLDSERQAERKAAVDTVRKDVKEFLLKEPAVDLEAIKDLPRKERKALDAEAGNKLARYLASAEIWRAVEALTPAEREAITADAAGDKLLRDLHRAVSTNDVLKAVAALTPDEREALESSGVLSKLAEPLNLIDTLNTSDEEQKQGLYLTLDLRSKEYAKGVADLALEDITEDDMVRLERLYQQKDLGDTIRFAARDKYLDALQAKDPEEYRKLLPIYDRKRYLEQILQDEIDNDYGPEHFRYQQAAAALYKEFPPEKKNGKNRKEEDEARERFKKRPHPSKIEFKYLDEIDPEYHEFLDHENMEDLDAKLDSLLSAAAKAYRDEHGITGDIPEDEWRPIRDDVRREFYDGAVEDEFGEDGVPDEIYNQFIKRMSNAFVKRQILKRNPDFEAYGAVLDNEGRSIDVEVIGNAGKEGDKEYVYIEANEGLTAKVPLDALDRGDGVDIDEEPEAPEEEPDVEVPAEEPPAEAPEVPRTSRVRRLYENMTDEQKEAARRLAGEYIGRMFSRFFESDPGKQGFEAADELPDESPLQLEVADYIAGMDAQGLSDKEIMRRLGREWHPDVNPTAEDTERFKIASQIMAERAKTKREQLEEAAKAAGKVSLREVESGPSS